MPIDRSTTGRSTCSEPARFATARAISSTPTTSWSATSWARTASPTAAGSSSPTSRSRCPSTWGSTRTSRSRAWCYQVNTDSVAGRGERATDQQGAVRDVPVSRPVPAGRQLGLDRVYKDENAATLSRNYAAAHLQLAFYYRTARAAGPRDLRDGAGRAHVPGLRRDAGAARQLLHGARRHGAGAGAVRDRSRSAIRATRRRATTTASCCPIRGRSTRRWRARGRRSRLDPELHDGLLRGLLRAERDRTSRSARSPTSNAGCAAIPRTHRPAPCWSSSARAWGCRAGAAPTRLPARRARPRPRGTDADGARHDATDSHALVTGAPASSARTLASACWRAATRVTGVDCFTDYYDPGAQAAQPRGRARVTRRSRCSSWTWAVTTSAALPDVDVVFHQAAQPGVRASWGAEFAHYTHHNVLATQRLLERYRGRPLERFVYASSSSVYGDAERYPTDEDLLPRPFSPYGVTKLAGEHLTLLYGRNFGLPVAALRYFTVYGPRQRPDMAFHRFCRALLRGRADHRLRRRPAVARLHVHRRRGRGQRARLDAEARRRGSTTSAADRRSRCSRRSASLERADRRECEARLPAAPARRSAAHPRRRDPDRTRSRLRRRPPRSSDGLARRGRVGARAVRSAGTSALTAVRPSISAVVPAYNEAESLPELHRELVAALEALGRSWEILYVDDGSRDGTDEVLERLTSGDPRVRGVVAATQLRQVRGPGDRRSDWCAATTWSRSTPTCRTTRPSCRD